MYKKSNSKERDYLQIEEDKLASSKFNSNLTFVKSRPSTSQTAQTTTATQVSTASTIQMLTDTADNYDMIFDEIIKTAKSKSTIHGQQQSQENNAICTKENMVEAFLDLAKTLKIDLSTFVLKQVITLISHGVQPDDIFLFLKEATANKYAKKKVDERGYFTASSSSSKNTEL